MEVEQNEMAEEKMISQIRLFRDQAMRRLPLLVRPWRNASNYTKDYVIAFLSA